jgi:hypothetical protein
MALSCRPDETCTETSHVLAGFNSPASPKKPSIASSAAAKGEATTYMAGNQIHNGQNQVLLETRGIGVGELLLIWSLAPMDVNTI